MKGVGWNVSFIPADRKEAILHILNRDYSHILEDENEASFYPIVINKDGEMAWNIDDFFMTLMTSGLVQLDFDKLAMDTTKQALRKRLYMRMGYTLQKYNALWW